MLYASEGGGDGMAASGLSCHLVPSINITLITTSVANITAIMFVAEDEANLH